MPQPPSIQIDVRSTVPAYRQIVGALRAQLVEGCLKPGHVLPAVRRLAMELGIHFNTVAQAYRTLAEEGWLDLRHGRGATVIQRTALSSEAGDLDSLGFRQRLRELVAQARANGLAAVRISSELKLLAERLEND